MSTITNKTSVMGGLAKRASDQMKEKAHLRHAKQRAEFAEVVDPNGKMTAEERDHAIALLARQFARARALGMKVSEIDLADLYLSALEDERTDVA